MGGELGSCRCQLLVRKKILDLVHLVEMKQERHTEVFEKIVLRKTAPAPTTRIGGSPIICQLVERCCPVLPVEWRSEIQTAIRINVPKRGKSSARPPIRQRRSRQEERTLRRSRSQLKDGLRGAQRAVEIAVSLCSRVLYDRPFNGSHAFSQAAGMLERRVHHRFVAPILSRHRQQHPRCHISRIK